MSKLKVVLVIHGGAGVLTPEEMKAAGVKRDDYEKALAEALGAGYRVWMQQKTSTLAVEAAIRVMEDSGLFNAGRGAAFSQDGRVELEAALMEGNLTVDGKETMKGKMDPGKRAGAVAGVTHIDHPISAARVVMEDQRHVLLAGEGAEWFILSDDIQKRYRINRVSNIYFWTARRLQQIREESQPQEKKNPLQDSKKGRGHGAERSLGTVGAVALDPKGHLAAGTSTGGLTNKLPGRIGDSPLIGSGTYADDRACSVSCTGTGEVFIRYAVAHDVIARMLYKEIGVDRAAQEAIDQLPDQPEGVGGLIALDKEGQEAFAMSANSVGMYRGYVTEKGQVYVAIYAGDKFKPM